MDEATSGLDSINYHTPTGSFGAGLTSSVWCGVNFPELNSVPNAGGPQDFCGRVVGWMTVLIFDGCAIHKKEDKRYNGCMQT